MAGLLAAVSAWAVVTAQDPAPPAADPVQRAIEALPYLASQVPEQRTAAERLVEAAAEPGFERLLELLDSQPRAGREVLLRLLANTRHPGRLALCVDTLLRTDAGRPERTTSLRALRSVEAAQLVEHVAGRLRKEGLTGFERVQCASLLGTVPAARAQGLLEELLQGAEKGSLQRALVEEALLRSVLASSFAEPAFARYVKRHGGACKCTLKELQEALVDLALPVAAERRQAELRLAEMVAGDVGLLLALSRSELPERAAFGLTRLRTTLPAEYRMAALAVVLDIVLTGEQTAALLALEVAIAGIPPTPAEMESLRPVAGGEAIARLESVLEAIGRAGNLAQVRREFAGVEAALRPLLARQGPFDPEAQEMLDRFATLREQLDSLEAVWRGGWRDEFEAEILGIEQE
ncbi:MAG: hypothetical protein IT463_10715 [Planctomycetes bacterium]|nr:hypothetical protein [Planctomycetota bacterium]